MEGKTGGLAVFDLDRSVRAFRLRVKESWNKELRAKGRPPITHPDDLRVLPLHCQVQRRLLVHVLYVQTGTSLGGKTRESKWSHIAFA